MTRLCQRFCLDLFSIWKLDFKTHYGIRQWLVLDHRTVLHLQKHDLRPWWRALGYCFPWLERNYILGLQMIVLIHWS